MIPFGVYSLYGDAQVLAGVGEVGIDLESAPEGRDGLGGALGAIEGDAPVAEERGALGKASGEVAIQPAGLLDLAVEDEGVGEV